MSALRLEELPAVDARDEAAVRERARVDGCLRVRGIAPLPLVRGLRALVDGKLAERGWLVEGRSDPLLGLGRWDDPRWVAFLGEVMAHPAFAALGRAAPLMALLRVVLGAEVVPGVGDVLRLVSPGRPEWTTPPHQDAGYLGRAGVGPGADGDAEAEGAARVWTVWLPLGRCPLELGSLAVVRGSHAGGLRGHAAAVAGTAPVGLSLPADTVYAAADLDEGDAILFSSLTIHRALPNRTAFSLRVSADYRYRAR